MKTNLYHCLILLLWVLPGSMVAQKTGNKTVTVTLPAVALLDVEPAGAISMSFSAPAEAGGALINPSNNSKWLNYTSAIVTGGSSQRVTASINQLVPGIAVRLQAASASGAGGGVLGTPSGLVTLGTTPATIISGIGGAFTGSGVSNGHQLTIALAPNGYANLSAGVNTQVVITYTLSAN